MALVDYASSSSASKPASPSESEKAESETDQDDHTSRKRRCLDATSTAQAVETSLPPLPQAFHDLYATPARVSTSDDPALHQGRKRASPHVQGSWPTHVYLEWLPSTAEARALTALIDAVATTASGTKLYSLMTSDLSTALPLHVSLSVPLSLTTPQHDAFLPALRPALTASGVNAFTVRLGSPRWVSNHDGTRWFLVVGIVKPENDKLNCLLKTCNGVARQFGVPELYVDDGDAQGEGGKRDWTDAFHFSVAWTLTAPKDGSVEGVDDAVIEVVRRIRVRFDAAKVKVGSVITAVPFGGERREERRTFFE